MKIDDQKALEILVKEEYISKKDLKDAIEKSEKSNLTPLNYLINNNLLSIDLIGQAMAEYFGVSYADLNTSPPTAEQVSRIPEEIAKKFNAVIFKEDKREVVVATDDPKNPELAENLKTIFSGKKVALVYGMTVDIKNTFANYKTKLSTRFSEIIKAEGKVAPELTLEIISDALDLNASDIHFEPKSNETIIRFRIDGILHEVGKISKEYYENIINFLKISASLRIDEHRSTQDGAIRFNTKTDSADARLSIVPVVDGEKVVLRILSRHISDLSMENIGFSEDDQKIFENAIRKPFGMIIISGPTGSGKTTTLYSLISKISNPEINITTIEDPVEYIMDSANQIQVNNEAGVTFAKGLRSIVRQDPDVILVGEIRDRETAEISVNAALTGHLLFSTFHANNAATTFLRLGDMGIEKFLLASTIEMVAAQRLLRRICEKCRSSRAVDESYLSKFPSKFRSYLKNIPTVYFGKGCPVCNGTGYKGRIAAFEIIQVTPEIQDLILKNATAGEIWELAKKQGAKSLFEDACEKAKLGTTSFEEVFRVAPPQ
jgi:type IV pilus assembly protein PilB